MVMGGMVLETNMNEIVTQIDAQNKLEKSEVRTKSIQLFWAWSYYLHDVKPSLIFSSALNTATCIVTNEHSVCGMLKPLLIA